MTLASLRIVLPFTLLCMLFIPLVQGQEIASCEDGEFLTLKETGLECSALPVSEGSSRATSDKTCNSNQFLNHNGTEWACISFPNPPAPPTLSDFVDIDETIGGGICESDKFLTLAIVEDELKLQCAKPPSRESGIPDGGTAGQVLTKSAKLKSVWADVESAGASLLSLLPVERTYVAFPSFSANDVTLVGGNTRINIDDATEFNEGDWVVIKQSGESNEKAIERGSVARVVNNEGKTTFQNWSADFKSYTRAGKTDYVYANVSTVLNHGQLNKDATSATNYGSAETKIGFLGPSYQHGHILFYAQQGYVPSEVTSLDMRFSIASGESVSFNTRKVTDVSVKHLEDYDRFEENPRLNIVKDFIEANRQQRIFVQTSYLCDCVVLAGDYKSEIQNQDNIALIKTRLGENVQKSLILNDGVEGQVLTKTAESFAWAGGFTNHDLLSLILAGKKSITLPSFSENDVSLIEPDSTGISIVGDTTGLNEGDWVVIKRSGESNEEAIKRGSVTRVVGKRKIIFGAYSVDFEPYSVYGKIGYVYSDNTNGNVGMPNRGQIKFLDPAIAMTYLDVSQVEFFGVSAITSDDAFSYITNRVPSWGVWKGRFFNITLSTSPTNSVSFRVSSEFTSRLGNATKYEEIGQKKVALSFLEANHDQRIFVEVSYNCNCIELAGGGFASQIQSQDNIALYTDSRAKSAKVKNDGVTIGTEFQNYSVDFDRDSRRPRYAYIRITDGNDDYFVGKLNKEATSATSYGEAETEVTFFGPSSNSNNFHYIVKKGYVPPHVKNLHIVLSTSPTNYVVFLMEYIGDENNGDVRASRFSETGIGANVGKAFITENHDQRIFAQISYP